MTLMRVTNTWLNRLYKTVAVLLVLFAVLMSSLRLFLPYAENYRQEFQDYVNSQYKGEVIIGQLTTGWRKFGPALVAKRQKRTPGRRFVRHQSTETTHQ